MANGTVHFFVYILYKDGWNEVKLTTPGCANQVNQNRPHRNLKIKEAHPGWARYFEKLVEVGLKLKTSG